MKKHIGIVTFFAAIMFACNNTNQIDTKKPDAVDSLINQQTLTDVQDEHQQDSIVLNNGVKWKVKPEMLLFLRKMEGEVKKFAGEKNGKNLNDYQKLSVFLQKNIDELTSNCTMEGKAHDELHKWLLPYIEMVDELNNSKSEKEAAAEFSDIENSFIEFNKYFE